jgi:hypothetical protein
MFKVLRRAFHVMSSQTRNMDVERNLYHIRYIIPKRDCKLGSIRHIEDNDEEIIITFINPEITQFVKKPAAEPEQIEKYHYPS